MLDGMQPTGKVQLRLGYSVNSIIGQVKPQGDCWEMLRWQVKGFLTDYFIGKLGFLLEAEHRSGNFNFTKVHLYLSTALASDWP